MKTITGFLSFLSLLVSVFATGQEKISLSQNSSKKPMSNEIARRNISTVSPVADTTLKTLDTTIANLQSKDLETILINAQSRVIDQDPNKTVYHVQSDSDAPYSYIYDILKKVPGIFTDYDNEILVNGSQNFLLLINGRKSALMNGNLKDILQSFPASNVVDIEVYQNPPPRYSAEGVTAVVNLVLKKRNIAGYNGSLSNQVGSPTYNNSNLSLLVKKGIVSYSTQTGLSNRRNPEFTSDYEFNNFSSNQKIVKMGKGNSSSNGYYTNHELAFQIDSINLLSYNFSSRRDRSANAFQNETNNFIIGEAIINSFQSKTNGARFSGSSVWGLDYETNIFKNKKNLFSLSYQDYETVDTNRNNFEILPEVNYAKSNNKTDNLEIFREKTFQLNYNNPHGLNALDVGFKVISRANTSNFRYEVLDNATNEFALDPINSNMFRYTQNVYSAYGTYNLRIKKTSLVFGGSLENADIIGKFISDASSIRRNYLNFIPNISLSRKMNGYNIKIGYSQRVERPGLYYLNPYVNRIDPFYLTYGNPNLNPAITNNFSSNLNIYRSKYSLGLQLNQGITNNAILQYTSIGQDKVTHSTYGNIGMRMNTSFTLTSNFSINKVMNFGFIWNPSYIKYSSTISDNSIIRSGFNQNVSGNFSFTLPDNLKFSGNASYYSTSVTVQGRSSSFLNTGLNLNKDFGKKRQLSVTLSIINPHQKNRRYFIENTDPNFYYFSETIFVIKQYTARVSYRFGGYEGHVAKRRKGISNTDLKATE